MPTTVVVISAAALSVCVGVIWGVIVARRTFRGSIRFAVGVMLVVVPVLLGATATTLMVRSTHKQYVQEVQRQSPRFELTVNAESVWLVPVRTTIDVYEPGGVDWVITNSLVGDTAEKPPLVWLLGCALASIVVWCIAGVTWFLVRKPRATGSVSSA